MDDYEVKKRGLDSDREATSKKIKPNDVQSSGSQLENVHKNGLDFDMDKKCSLTNSRINVYCCLICGKYLQGRKTDTPAFIHSVDENHNIFIHFKTLKFYYLPTGVELKNLDDNTLANDIKFAIKPEYSEYDLAVFPSLCYDSNGNSYTNGFVGISDQISSGSLQAVLHLIAHITPFRNYFLLKKFDVIETKNLEYHIGCIIKKLWSNKLFRSHVSANELLGFIAITKNFNGLLNDPKLCYLSILRLLMNTSKDLSRLFRLNNQGKLQIRTTKENSDSEEVEKEAYFWMLTLEFPTTTVLKSVDDFDTVAQIQLAKLLEKYDGSKSMKITKHPRYLFLHYNRFNKNENFPVKDRNKTLVNFPLEMNLNNCKYKLVANIVHETNSIDFKSEQKACDEKSYWKFQTYCSLTDQWCEFDGIEVKEKKSELLFLDETYLQVWERL